MLLGSADVALKSRFSVFKRQKPAVLLFTVAVVKSTPKQPAEEYNGLRLRGLLEKSGSVL